MKKTYSLCAATLLAAQLVTPVVHASGNITMPTDHAPIGVMGDHTHSKGEWMLAYRFARMGMEGNRDGSRRLTPAQVRASFMVAPLKMETTMHMFGGMYGVNDRLTMTAMLPYIHKSMEMLNAGGRFKVSSEGFGDVKLGGIVTLQERDNHNLLLNLGMSLPTGSVNKRDNTPAGANRKLAYGMQIGSGTFDPNLGVTYNGRDHHWAWGGQLHTTLRLGENSENYTLGNVYKASTWIARDLSDAFSVSFRLEGRIWENIDGADPDLNPAMSPGARPDLRGGEQVDALFGVNFIQPEGKMKGHRLALEAGIPLHRNLDGPQLEADYRVMLGWQYAF